MRRPTISPLVGWRQKDFMLPSISRIRFQYVMSSIRHQSCRVTDEGLQVMRASTEVKPAGKDADATDGGQDCRGSKTEFVRAAIESRSDIGTATADLTGC